MSAHPPRRRSRSRRRRRRLPIWGFTGAFGYGGAGGDFGNLFRNPLTWDYEFFRQKGAWRVGAGLSYGGFKMKEPYQDELEWGFQQIVPVRHAGVQHERPVRPYIQVRGGIARLRPRSDLFKIDPLPPDFVSGEATKEKTDGFGVGVVPGLELKLSRGRVPGRLALLHLLQRRRLRPEPRRAAPRELGDGVGGAARHHLVPERRAARRRRRRRAARRLGREAQLRLGGRRGARDQQPRGLRRPVRAQRGLVGDEPAELVGEHQGRLPVRPRQVQDQPVGPPVQRRRLLQQQPRERPRLLAVRGLRPRRRLRVGDAAARRSRCRSTTCSPPRSAASRSASRSTASPPRSSNNQSSGMGRFWREFGAFFVDPVRGFNRLISGDAKKARGQPRRSDGLAAARRSNLRRDGRALDRRRLLDHEQHEDLRHDPAEPQLRRRLRHHAAQALRLHRLRRGAELRREGRARQRADPRQPRVLAARRRSRRTTCSPSSSTSTT